MSAPIIGVTGPASYRRSPAWLATRIALSRVGAQPIRLPPHGDPARVRELDGLVVGGGADVHPSLFGQAVLADAPSYDHARDRFELAVLELAWAERVPVLAICRGMQLMNVTFGGTLDQDVWQGIEGDTRNTAFAKHPARIDTPSLLHDVVRRKRILVNRIHRQAVAELGEGLRVTSWGLADVPQAIEPADDGEGRRWWLGVQWHPEYLFGRPAHQRLFRRLRDAARGRRQTRTASPSEALASFERMENA